MLDHVKSCTDLELILVATWMKKDGHGMTWDGCSEAGKLFCFVFSRCGGGCRGYVVDLKHHLFIHPETESQRATGRF